MAAKLILIDGTEEGPEFELLTPAVLIGRLRQCDIVLEGHGVSRSHAQLVQTPEGYVIRDLQSRNGVLINGCRIDSEQYLADGDVLQLGEARLVFSSGEGTVAAESTETPENLMTSILTAVDVAPTTEPLAELWDRDRMRLISRISQELAKSLELNTVLEQILETSLELFPGAQQAHLVLSPSGKRSVLSTVTRHRGTGTERPHAVSRTLISETMKSSRAFLSQDILQDNRFAQSSSIVASPLRRVMCAPMIVHDGEVIGAVQLAGSATEDPFEESDLDVLVCLSSMAALAIQNAWYVQSALERQKWEQEVHFAREIQLNFLPSAPPEIPGYDIVQYCSPAEAVGGDYFDYIPQDRKQVAFVIADVAGKGVPAALYMARLSADVRALLAREQTISQSFHELNRTIVRVSSEFVYVTCVLAVLDPLNHRLRLGVAGHPQPLLVRGGKVSMIPFEQDDCGPPIGLFKNEDMPIPFASTEVPLEKGDLLVFYTDGVIEALDPDGSLYGVERLIEVLERTNDSAQTASDAILRSLETFRRWRSPSDDTTFLCVRYHGTDPSRE